MLSREGRQYMEIAPRLAVWPGLCLTVVEYCLNMVGDAVRDLLDPRLRGGSGRLGAYEAVEAGRLDMAPRSQQLGEHAHQHEQHDDDDAEKAQRLLPPYQAVKEVRNRAASASRFCADGIGDRIGDRIVDPTHW